MDTVKSKRPYNSPSRDELARRNREAVIDAAARQFLECGYAATSIASVAEEAGVSVQMIYKVFGGKSGLVRGIYERGLLGRGAGPAFERSDAMRARESDPRKIMRRWGALTAEVASTVTPIRLLMRSAAVSDPDMAALVGETERTRLERARHHARFLQERGYLRQGVTIREATDVLWACTSVEFFDLFVIQRGWTMPRFGRFVADFMMASLLPAIEGTESAAPAADSEGE